MPLTVHLLALGGAVGLAIAAVLTQCDVPHLALVLTVLFLRGMERPGARIVVGARLTVLAVYLITAL